MAMTVGGQATAGETPFRLWPELRTAMSEPHLTDAFPARPDADLTDPLPDAFR